MKRYSASPVSRGMQTKSTMKCHFTPIRMATIKKEEVTGVSKDAQKMEPLCTIDGIVKWCNCYGKWYGDLSKKSKIDVLYDPTIPLLGICSKELKTGSKDIFAHPCS